MNIALAPLQTSDRQLTPSRQALATPRPSCIPSSNGSALNSENLQPATFNLQPSAPRKLTRNGKIARLPYLERDMVNRMLRNNIPASKIKDALDEHGYIVTQRNVSNWKTRGGYRE